MARELQVIFTNKGVYTYNGYENLPDVLDVIRSDLQVNIAYGYVCKDYDEYVKHIMDYLEKCYNLNNETEVI